MYVADRSVGALGITEVGPGYATLGQPWQYLKGLSIKSASAGTEGGIAWKYRPDTMSVWRATLAIALLCKWQKRHTSTM